MGVLAGLAVKLLGQKLFDRIPWDLVALVALAAGLGAALWWHARAIEALKTERYAAGHAAAVAAFREKQAIADAAAKAGAAVVAKGLSILDKEKTDALDTDLDDIARRARALRLQLEADARRKAGGGAVPGTSEGPGGVDDPKTDDGLPRPVFPSSLTLDDETALRAACEATGVRLDRLQEWEAQRYAIEDAAAKARAAAAAAGPR